MCFQFTHFLCDDWENIYTLSYYHHQIGSMNYYPLFRVRSWNNGMRCKSFYILMGVIDIYGQSKVEGPRLNLKYGTRTQRNANIRYSDVIMSAMASQITGVSIVCFTVYSGADQRKQQSSAWLAFGRGTTGGRWIPLTETSHAENVSIWWRHHAHTEKYKYQP